MAEKTAFRRILVTSGTGTGRTELSALDAALVDAGIFGYNIFPLSSVIPFGFTVEIVEQERKKLLLDHTRLGDKLYVVIARNVQAQFGDKACAGLGWVNTVENTHTWGLFVEHTGSSESYVSEHIRLSLDGMTQNRLDYKFGEVQALISSIACEGPPVAAVVVAVYALERW